MPVRSFIFPITLLLNFKLGRLLLVPLALDDTSCAANDNDESDVFISLFVTFRGKELSSTFGFFSPPDDVDSVSLRTFNS